MDGLTCTIAPGVVTGFLGPNGAGKSTTMRMIVGLDRPTAGTATVAGLRYHEHKHPLRTVGALLDARQVHPNRTARSHLRWIAATNRIPVTRVDQVLADVGSHRGGAGKQAGSFSLGMLQRLGIAAALLGDPPVLLFDEPVNGLDPEGIRWIRTLMRKLAGRGSHRVRVQSSAGRDGQHRRPSGGDRTGPPHRRHHHGGLPEPAETVRVRSPQADRLAALLPGARRDGDALLIEAHSTEQVGDLAAANGIVLHELSAQRASLEEAYMDLTDQAVQYRARLMNAIAAERIKLTSTRSPLWLALTVVVLSLGLAAIQAVAALPYSTVGPDRAGLGVAMFGVPVLMILSALTVTGEYRTSMIRTTFMATPRRSRVLIAKAVVGDVALRRSSRRRCRWVRWCWCGRCSTSARVRSWRWTRVRPWRTVAAITLYAVLAALLAVGLGALVRHSAAVIAVLLLMPFVVEPLLGATPGVGSRIGPLFPFANANAFTEIPWLQSFSMWWGPVGSAVYFAAVAATVFAAAVAVTARRDP